MCRALFPTLAALLLLPAAASADDWLALYPECGFPPSVLSPGQMAMVYPRAGLPAVVPQGEPLHARVRVPSGLTPPPGIQQDRALVGWSAELVGNAVAIGTPVEHRYPLRVVDVRPDGPSSLVYRATVLVPAWAAPGTYGLRLTAPGGGQAVAGAVRIIPSGEAPRVAVARPVARPAEADPALAARALWESLAHLPVDVWILPDDPGLRAALARAPLSVVESASVRPVAPLLLLPAGPAGLPVVLHHGPEALVLGSCDGRFVRFADHLDGVLRSGGLRPRPLSPADLPPPGTWRFVGEEGEARPLPGADPVRLEPIEGGWRIVADRALSAPAEVTVVVPEDGRATRIEGGTASWWPATPVPGVAVVPSLAARVEVAPGATARVVRAEGADLALRVEVDPPEVATRVPADLRARPSRAVERIAWQLDEDLTALGDATRHRWGVLGRHRVHALAIGPEGVAARATAEVQVHTREVTGCDCRAAAPPAGRDHHALFWILAVLLLKTGHRRWRGNSRRRPRR